MPKLVIVQLNDTDEHDKLVKSLPEGAVIFDEFISREERNKKYSFWFDSESGSWSGPPHDEYNWLFLRSQQNWANDMLRARGHIFLNEILGMLGIPATNEGALVGWFYQKDNPNGDNFVDFGCWGQEGEGHIQARSEGAILLTFNPDGPIFQNL